MSQGKTKFKHSYLAISLSALLVACASQPTTITPSSGHIDGKNTAPNQAEAEESKKPTADETAKTETVDATKASIPKPITQDVYLPPPKPAQKPQTYSVVVYDTPVKEVLFAIARDSQLNIDIHPSIQGNVTLNAVDQPLKSILKRLAKQVDLTYRVENNVLFIAPDMPVLRNYKIDYVNMSRNTTGFIGADGQISSTSQIAGAGGNISNSAGNGANNSSRTAINSEGSNQLWHTLIQNIKDILNETDKTVMVSRFGTTMAPDSSIDMADQTASQQYEQENMLRQQQQAEYKTLYAAKVIANPETGIVSVRATNKQHERVKAFIDQVMGSAKRQVLIEATIVEVSLKDGFQSGIDWSRFGNTATSSGFTFQQSLGPTVDPTGTGFSVGYINPVSNLGNIAGSINLLQQFGDTKVLSSPKLMVLNNQTAVLKVVDNLVYFTVQVQQTQGTAGGNNAFNTVTTTPNTVPVGVVMSVTPQISDANMVNINVRPTISRKIDDVIDPNPQLRVLNVESRIPVIQVREMESILQIKSGNTAVLGGLMEDTIQRNTDQVPSLADVPVVGEVLKGKDNLTQKTELVIFLRPTVVPNASLESDELAGYQEYLPINQLEKTIHTNGQER